MKKTSLYRWESWKQSYMWVKLNPNQKLRHTNIEWTKGQEETATSFAGEKNTIFKGVDGYIADWYENKKSGEK